MRAGIETAPDPDQDINELYALSRRPLSQENGADPPLPKISAGEKDCGGRIFLNGLNALDFLGSRLRG